MRRFDRKIFIFDSGAKVDRIQENRGLLKQTRLFLRKIEETLQKNRMFRNGKVYVRHSNQYEIVIFLIFCDSLRLHHSILLLLSKGHVESAAILNRLLLERTVDALYVSKSSKIRAERYLKFWSMNRSKLLIKFKEEFDFPKPDDAERFERL